MQQFVQLTTPIQSSKQKTWNAMHLQNFLIEYKHTNTKQNINKTRKYNKITPFQKFLRLARKPFAKQSSCWQKEYSQINHFGRYSHDTPQTQQNNYIIQNYCIKRKLPDKGRKYKRPQTANYYLNITQKRQIQQKKKQDSIFLRRSYLVQKQHKSGVLGFNNNFLSKSTCLKQTPQNYKLRNQIYGNVFQNKQEQNKQAIKRYEFNNILSKNVEDNINKGRIENIKRNEVRRNFNFLNFQKI